MDRILHNLPPAVMFQGTSSNVGKSLLTAAVCRIAKRLNIKVAPFKAQNMSLNSWVTADNGEMGIAQALQARAAGIEPTVLMNPVLLKPMGNAGSQIIILGQPRGILRYEEYLTKKPELWHQVTQAYARIANENDLMVIEGAGSPAEINLRPHDIVNMRMAHHAEAKVLLVADIDKGGAFAALAGTMMLLRQADRKAIAGFILNKFRGNPHLLTSALDEITRKFHRPFAGIIPMLDDLELPEEDSMHSALGRVAQPGKLDIAIINLPALSNVSDWDPLLAEPAVCCRKVDNGAEFGNPHAVILPGSRNVPAALDWLKRKGLIELLLQFATKITTAGRGQLIGICAGLQILGQAIHDPHGIEKAGTHAGLGLLPISTRLEPAKTLSPTKAIAHMHGQSVQCSGREIHHGKCETALPSFITSTSGRALGWSSKERIWGTWLHGIFDEDELRHHWLSHLAEEFGLPPLKCKPFDLEKNIDRLADHVSKHLDMQLLLSWMQERK